MHEGFNEPSRSQACCSEETARVLLEGDTHRGFSESQSSTIFCLDPESHTEPVRGLGRSER